MSAHCTATASAGTPCEAPPVDGGSLCFFHAGGAALKEAASKGGRHRRRRTLPPGTPMQSIQNPEDLRRLTEVTLHQLRTGQIDTKVATGIGYLISAGLKVIELTDVDRRLRRLETREDKASDATIFSSSSNAADNPSLTQASEASSSNDLHSSDAQPSSTPPRGTIPTRLRQAEERQAPETLPPFERFVGMMEGEQRRLEVERVKRDEERRLERVRKGRGERGRGDLDEATS